MSARRSRQHRNLPIGLYRRPDGYYYYRDSTTGKTFGLGRDKAAAIAQVAEATMRAAARRAEAAATGAPRLAERMEGVGGTFGDWLVRYREHVSRRRLAEPTREAISQHLATAEETFGHMPLASISTRLVADYLTTWTDEGRARMAQAVRSQLFEVFRAAIAAGWIERNPVEPTRLDNAEVKRERMTLDLWHAIYKLAQGGAPSWLPRLLELAILTGQRREDLREMRYRDVHDGRENGNARADSNSRSSGCDRIVNTRVR